MEEQNVAKSTIKRMIFSGVIFVLLVSLTFWLVLKDQDVGMVLNAIIRANPLFILLGIMLMLGYFSIEAWNIMTLLRGFGENITFKQALRYVFIEFFFCSVTPGASGGQPIEIYYMNKEGIKGINATIAILIQTCGIQIAVMTFGTICLLLSPDLITPNVYFLFLIGFLINLVALIVLLIGLFSGTLALTIINFVFKLLEKIGIKAAKKWQKNMVKLMEQYEGASDYIKGHKKEFWQAIGRSMLQMLVYFLVPFCTYKAMGFSGFPIWETFAMQSILFVATSGLPLPGAVGASEPVFLSLYGVIFGGLVDSAMLINRGISFYLFVFVSMIVVFASTAKKKKITKRNRE